MLTIEEIENELMNNFQFLKLRNRNLAKECEWMKKKIILSIAFLISLLPMLFNQYGGLKGVQEITGLINLLNPIGIVSVILFVLGVWFPFKKRVVSKSLGALGVIGIVVSEIYKFLTWHTLTVTGEVSLQNSIRLAFPELYIGLTISLASKLGIRTTSSLQS